MRVSQEKYLIEYEIALFLKNLYVLELTQDSIRNVSAIDYYIDKHMNSLIDKAAPIKQPKIQERLREFIKERYS